MNLLLRKLSPIPIALVLTVAILAAEFALIEHAIEHSFSDSDEVCFVCEKADTFQNTLAVASALAQISGATELNAGRLISIRPSTFLAAFHARAPPGSCAV